jgi:hypothetical protein
MTVWPILHQLSGVGGAAIAVAKNTVANSVFILLPQFAGARNSAISAKNASLPAGHSRFRQVEGGLPYFTLKLRENCDSEEKPVATATSRTLNVE